MPHFSPAASNLGFPSAQLFLALCSEPNDMFDHSSGQMFRGLVVLYSFVSLPWTHIHPSGGFGLSQRESCHADPRFRQWLFAIHVPIIISGRLLKYIKACFVCFWPSRWFRRIGRRPLEQHDSDMCNHRYYSRNLRELQDMALDFRLFPSSDKCFLNFLPDVTTRLVYSGGKRLSFLQDFAHSTWECNFIVSFLNVHFCWFESLYVNFRCGNVLRSSVSALNGSQVQHPPAFNAYSENYPRKTFADALDLGLVFCRQKSSILVLLQMKPSDHQKDQSGLQETWWEAAMEWYWYLRHVQDLPADALRRAVQFTNTDEVPSFTRRTARSAIPWVSDLYGVDLSWFQFCCSQAWTNSWEVSTRMDLGFLLDVRSVKDFSASPELSWLCMDNIGSIESPGLAQPLHVSAAFLILALH